MNLDLEVKCKHWDRQTVSITQEMIIQKIRYNFQIISSYLICNLIYPMLTIKNRVFMIHSIQSKISRVATNKSNSL